MMHGQEKDIFELSFSVPSDCADQVQRGEVDLGIIPVAEVQRLNLPYFRDVGIGGRGPVRTILLISKKDPADIRILAADSSSRTSVLLTRLILARKYGCKPAIQTVSPDLDRMLERADAALIIGDPALRIEPGKLPYQVLDLGKEWTEMTGRPMVFALWSGQQQFMTETNRKAFADSCRFGLEHLEDIVRANEADRNISADLIRTYLTKHITFELNADDHRGLQLFWSYAAELDS